MVIDCRLQACGDPVIDLVDRGLHSHELSYACLDHGNRLHVLLLLILLQSYFFITLYELLNLLFQLFVTLLLHLLLLDTSYL